MASASVRVRVLRCRFMVCYCWRELAARDYESSRNYELQVCTSGGAHIKLIYLKDNHSSTYS